MQYYRQTIERFAIFSHIDSLIITAMMYVRTKLEPSPIHGTGIFADTFIPKGTIVWKFTADFDIKLRKEDVLKLPPEAQIHIRTYAYLSKKSNLYILAVGNGKYFNHSETPNTLSEYFDDEEEAVTRAVQDIAPGEEMTDDYRSFEKDLTGLSWAWLSLEAAFQL
jgi:SET domain-containing protein